MEQFGKWVYLKNIKNESKGQIKLLKILGDWVKHNPDYRVDNVKFITKYCPVITVAIKWEAKKLE